jgi:hypothetical protein
MVFSGVYPLDGSDYPNLRDALDKLKLSDAAGGTGTAVDALQRLHLTASDLQALPLDERIVAIQDALAKFVPPAERAAVASALFGDKAALAFSRINSATLRQASQDITDFGVAVSDQDADQIRTAGDAIDRLGLVWLGLTNQLTVAVAPALEMVANALADATRVGGVFQTSISFLGRPIGRELIHPLCMGSIDSLTSWKYLTFVYRRYLILPTIMFNTY